MSNPSPAFPASSSRPSVADLASDLASIVPMESVTNPDEQFAVQLSRGEGQDVSIRVVPPAGTTRAPTNLVCVVDVSGSMSSAADPPDGGEKTGLNLLDVVKHALNTAIHTLGPNDTFALVPFSTTAHVALPFTAMDASGLAKAIAAVNSMQPQATTNMWDGMKKALDLVHSSADPSKQSAIFVFTDGVPNQIPPQGHQAAYEEYQREHRVCANMSCFGFGYNLDSALLDNMSSIGGGVYSFIPDVGMVGTVFVHAVSNLLSCVASDCVVTVEAKDGSAVMAQDLPLLNADSLVESGSRMTFSDAGAATNKLTFDLGMVNFGQARDVVVQAKNPSELSVTVTCRVRDHYVQMVGVFGPDDPVRCSVQKARAHVVRSIAKARGIAVEDLTTALAGTSAVAESITKLLETLHDGDDDVAEKYLSDLLQDVEGQIALSMSREDWFRKWGVHYLPSIQRAHVLQQCLNFKDPGMQHYGGDVFRDVRDVADDKFNELPAPVPSRPPARQHAPGGFGGAAVPFNAAPISMAQFNNACGGCFASGRVLLATGERREVSEIAKGDRLLAAAPGGGAAVEVVVDRVVETRFGAEQLAELVDLGDGVLATPWHPVFAADGTWKFPADIKPTVNLHVPAVYCFFLEEGSTFNIGGWEAVALGHELTGPVVSHPFFASRARIAKALDALPTTDGRVILRAGSCLERDEDGLVCGFRAPESLEASMKSEKRESLVDSVLHEIRTGSRAPESC